MKFEDVEKIYYKNFNKHVNKEKFLEWLLKTINDIVELKDEIEIGISVDKCVLERMNYCISEDRNIDIVPERAKITIKVLKKLLLLQASSEQEKAYINFVVTTLENCMNARSQRANKWNRNF